MESKEEGGGRNDIEKGKNKRILHIPTNILIDN
jgi:hypothetical protein